MLEEDDGALEDKRVLATLDYDCAQLAVYERVTLMVRYFTVDLDSSD